MIEIRNASMLFTQKGFGKADPKRSFKALDNVSLTIPDGCIYGFLGSNGAGKSTTIRHLMGFSKPDSGETFLFGKPTFEKYSEILSRVGYIPGEIALPTGLSGSEFIRMMQDMQGIHNHERLARMLDMFKVDNIMLKSETKRMSLGEKRKLAVVVAFMHDPEVLILDEPTSGLDPVMQNNFIEFIREEKQCGKTILLSSHIFSEVDATCDRIAIIKDGKIVSEFVADDLKHASLKYYEIKFMSTKDTADFIKKSERIASLQILKNDDNTLYLSIEDKDMNATISLLSEYEIEKFSNRRESLEDYFMKFYKEEKDFGGVLS